MSREVSRDGGGKTVMITRRRAGRSARARLSRPLKRFRGRRGEGGEKIKFQLIPKLRPNAASDEAGNLGDLETKEVELETGSTGGVARCCSV